MNGAMNGAVDRAMNGAMNGAMKRPSASRQGVGTEGPHGAAGSDSRSGTVRSRAIPMNMRMRKLRMPIW